MQDCNQLSVWIFSSDQSTELTRSLDTEWCHNIRGKTSCDEVLLKLWSMSPGRRLLTGIHHPMSLALACFPNNKSWLSQQLNCLSICRVFVFNFNKVPTHDIPSHFPACIMQVSHMERSWWRYRKAMHSCIMTMNKMSLAVTQLHTLLVYIEMQTDLWLDQFMLSEHTSTI